MNKSFLILILFLFTQILTGCASYHHDRFPSSVDDESEQFYKRNPRLRR